MNSNKQIITEFLNAWERLDSNELTGYFADEGIYHNIPLAPVTGKKEIEEFIISFTADWTETRWEILNIVSNDAVVIAERMDRTLLGGGKSVELPCMGIFEMENGKIKVWRDYFDLGTYMKALE